MRRVRPSRVALCLLSLASAVLAGCNARPTPAGGAAAEQAAATEPAAGAPSWPRRILSAAPSVTEMICDLGLRDRLVGRTRYCIYPPDVADVPVFGDLLDVDLERVHGFHPDLIVISGQSRAQADRFQSLGIRVEALPDTCLADIFTALRTLGDLCGAAPAAAAACERLKARLDAVDAARADRSSARVLICLGALSDPPRPPHVAATGSFYDDLLRRGGHVNAAPASAAAFAPLSIEGILAADPDVIVEFAPEATGREAGDEDALRAWGRIGDLRAVKARRVRTLSGAKYYVPGPRVSETYADLMAAIERRD